MIKYHFEDDSEAWYGCSPAIQDYIDFGATSEDLLGDLSDLDDDPDFKDFLKERYEEKAYRHWSKYGSDY